MDVVDEAYKQRFPIGSTVLIADLHRLEEFQRTWKFHHKLDDEQLRYAGQVRKVEKVGFYHGGDVIYELRGAPGSWHQRLLEAAG